jgi:hypothetical protein
MCTHHRFYDSLTTVGRVYMTGERAVAPLQSLFPQICDYHYTVCPALRPSPPPPLLVQSSLNHTTLHLCVSGPTTYTFYFMSRWGVETDNFLKMMGCCRDLGNAQLRLDLLQANIHCSHLATVPILTHASKDLLPCPATSPLPMSRKGSEVPYFTYLLSAAANVRPNNKMPLRTHHSYTTPAATCLSALSAPLYVQRRCFGTLFQQPQTSSALTLHIWFTRLMHRTPGLAN